MYNELKFKEFVWIVILIKSEKSHGFIYLVSLTGVTGIRKSLPTGIDNLVAKVRKESRLPLCVGFGISTAEQAANVARVADGVIVGSRLVQLITEQGVHYRPLTDFVTELREALDNLK